MEAQKYDSIGCYYTYDKCVIVKAKIVDQQAHLTGETFTHTSIEKICEVLREFPLYTISISQNIYINKIFRNRLKEFDFTDENLVSQVIDYYKSLAKDNKLIFNNIDCQKSHDLKALYLALNGIDITKLYDLKISSGFCFSSVSLG